MLLGAGLGIAGGYAGEKLQQKHQSEAAWHDFMSNAINQHPEIASTPEGQKQIAQIYGKEHAPIVTGFLQTAAHLKQQATDQYKMAANTKIAPAYNPQGAKLPDSPEAIQHEIQLIQGSIDNEALPKNLHEAGKAHIEALQKEYDRLQGAQLKTSDELAREGRAPGVEAAKTKARIGEETSPEAIAGASKKSAATSAAATNARENIELSPDTTAKKAKQEETLATVRERVKASVGKPWTEKDSLAARKSALEQAKTELTKPNRFLPGSTAPQPTALEARSKDILLSEGLDPATGKRLEDGDIVRLPNGKKLIWRTHPVTTAATGG